jgi:hypothetical protein
MIYNFTYMFVLSISFLIGTYYLPTLKRDTKIIWLYVGISFSIEWLGFYNRFISEEKLIKPIIYQYYSIIESILYYLYFRTILHGKDSQRLILLFFFLTLVVLFIDLYLNSQSNFQNFKFYLIPMILYSLVTILYFRQLLDSIIELKNNPNFWIVTGILFFNTSFFFLSGFINYIRDRDLNLATKLYSINHVLNIIYYSLITYGFICQRRLAKSSL